MLKKQGISQLFHIHGHNKGIINIRHTSSVFCLQNQKSDNYAPHLWKDIVHLD